METAFFKTQLNIKAGRIATGLFFLFPASLFGRPGYVRDSMAEAWQIPPNDPTEAWIERIAENELPQDTEEILARWQEYRDNPIDINRADAGAFRSLRILNEWQIAALLHYRESYGNIVQWQELSDYIPGFSPQTAQAIAPYVCIGNSSEERIPSPAEVIRNGKHRFMARYGRILQRTRAYTENKYAGPPDQYYFRYTFDYRNLVRLGFSAQHDAGESFRRQGFDFYAGYLSLARIGPIRNLTVGTYRLDWGFGLNVHSPGGFYGSIQPDMLAGSGQGIRPYASGAEYGYLQGVAAELPLPRSWKISAFYSGRNRDGTLTQGSGTSASDHPSDYPDTDSDEANTAPREDPPHEEDQNSDAVDGFRNGTASGSLADFLDCIRSFPETGYHRTVSEIAGKGAIRQQIYGLNAEKSFRSGRFGISLSAYRIGGRYTPERRTQTHGPTVFSEIKPYRGANLSAYYQCLVGRFHFYGEAAVDHRAAFAFLQGIQWKASDLFALSARYTHYSPGYYAAYAIQPNKLPPRPVSAGLQQQTFEWQARILLPASFTLEFQGEESFERKNRSLPVAVGRFGGTLRFQKSAFAACLRWQCDRSKTRSGHSLRAQASFRFKNGFFGESRLEMRNFMQGTALIQDFGYAGPAGGFRCRFRIALFHTQGYEARIYAYEHDVLYAASAPALYGKGVRFCIVLKQAFGKGFSAELKYAHTLLDGVQSVGSGNNQGEGFVRPELKIQLHYRF